MQLPYLYVDDIIRTALREDIHYLDTTTDLMIEENTRTTARFMAKAEGVVCGLDVALRVFELLDPTFPAKVLLPEGSTVAYGDIIAELEGNTRALLKGERTALNLLQHMSAWQVPPAGPSSWWKALKRPSPTPAKRCPACVRCRNTP